MIKLFLPLPVLLDRFLPYGRLDPSIFSFTLIWWEVFGLVVLLFHFLLFWVKIYDADLVREEIALFLLVTIGIRVIIIVRHYSVDSILSFSTTTDALGIREVWLLTLSQSITASLLCFLRVQVLQMFPTVRIEISHILLVSVIKTSFWSLLFYVGIIHVGLLIYGPLLIVIIHLDHILVW